MKDSEALSCLVDVIESNRLPRKALADEIGKTEQAFSKMTAGTQAFGMDDFGNLPRDVQVAFLKRYGKQLGLDVRELDYGEIAEEIFQRFEELGSLLKLAKVSKPAQLKVGIQERRREVG